MAVSSSEESQNVDSVILLPDGGTALPEYESQLNIVSHMEAINTVTSDMCLTTESNLENANLKMDEANNHAPCISDVDIETGKTEMPYPKSVENLKTTDSFIRTLQREFSLLIGGKLTQLLVNHSSELPKLAPRERLLTERMYDTLTSRSRKYKRSVSFNSRRVVLLFSVLSIIGTMILIYLTLHMWLLNDGFANV